MTFAEAVEIHQRQAWQEVYARAYRSEIIRGKNLASWCALWGPCRVDYYLELVNQ